MTPNVLRRVELENQEIKKWIGVGSDAGAGRIWTGANRENRVFGLAREPKGRMTSDDTDGRR